MATKSEKIRQNHDEYKAARKEGWGLTPVRKWGEFEYIVLTSINLQPGPQQIEVIDITNDADIARFAGVWPEINNMNGETKQINRDFALVLYGDEGGIFVMTEGQYSTTQRVSSGPLSIRVEPGTAEDRRDVRRQLQEDLDNADQIGWPLN